MSELVLVLRIFVSLLHLALAIARPVEILDHVPGDIISSYVYYLLITLIGLLTAFCSTQFRDDTGIPFILMIMRPVLWVAVGRTIPLPWLELADITMTVVSLRGYAYRDVRKENYIMYGLIDCCYGVMATVTLVVALL